ncbi:MAG: RloB domain-containing protein [Spirochaetes bacterium]|uniref:RloB domain-containing protein n=1 Tax=Candidatus Gallitreponema excrementavium TaxID=2840840 RepID=A0A9D9HMV8_9SPIR|nr:RloB domain-containing protein [Candidatus Gallitreponema excrementavium]
MPRKTGKLKVNKTFLLVVEGFTEQIYFSDVKTTRRIPGITINPKIAKHSDLSTILRTAIREYNTNAYDSVWCVFDRDTITEQGMSDDLKKQYNTALDLGIQFADSMPAFEVWFLLHFAMPSPFYISQDGVIKDLRKYISDYSKEQAWLSSAKLYSKLEPYFDAAEKRAIELDKKKSDSGDETTTFSHVYKLFKELKEKSGT